MGFYHYYGIGYEDGYLCHYGTPGMRAGYTKHPGKYVPKGKPRMGSSDDSDYEEESEAVQSAEEKLRSLKNSRNTVDRMMSEANAKAAVRQNLSARDKTTSLKADRQKRTESFKAKADAYKDARKKMKKVKMLKTSPAALSRWRKNPDASLSR